MSTQECRKVSPEDIKMVHHLIEGCLARYMTQKQAMDILYQQQNIEPTFTELIWQKLEEHNEVFFKTYHLRLMLKEQILKFNNLLSNHAALMNRAHPCNVMSSISHVPTMPFNPSCYVSDTGVVPKTANRQHSVPTVVPGGFNNSGMQSAHDLSAQFRRTDVPLDILLAHNSNVAIKTERGYLGNSRFVYQVGGNILDAHPAFMDSNSYQLDGALLDDTCSFEHFGQNIRLPGLLTDFTNTTDALRLSKSGFLLPDSDSLLESYVKHQGENMKQDNMSGNLGFQNFGRDS